MYLSQLIKATKPLPPIGLVHGPDESLVSLGVQEYARKRNAGSLIELDSRAEQLEAMSQSRHETTAFVLRDWNEETLLAFAKRPTPGVTLALKVVDLARKPQTLPNHANILEIKCPNGINGLQLISIAKAYGMQAEDAKGLASYVNDDPFLFCEALRILSAFPRPWAADLYRAIVPDPGLMISFSQFHVVDSASDDSLCQQLTRRFRQLAAVSLLGKQRLSVVDTAKAAGVDVFLVQEFKDMTRGVPASRWVERMATVETARSAALRHLPLVRDYLQVTLR